MAVTGRSMTVFGRSMARIDFLKYIATGRPLSPAIEHSDQSWTAYIIQQTLHGISGLV